VPHVNTDGEVAASAGRGEPEKTVESQANGRRLGGATGHGRDAAVSSEPPDSDWEIDPVLADRFASEFRPSWAPLSGGAAVEIPVVAPRLTVPPPAGVTVRPERIPRDMRTSRVTSTREEVVTVPGRHMKRRAATLAMLSIASFVALAYWGVSSATKPGFQTEISSATHGAAPPHAAETVTAPDPQHAAEAATPAPTRSSDLVVADRPTPTPIAADETQTPSAAAEPSAPPAPEAAAVAAAAAETAPATTSASAQPSTTSAADNVAAAKPTTAVPPSAATAIAQPAPKPATPALAVAAKTATPTAPHESTVRAAAAPPLAAAVVKKPEPTPQPSNDAPQTPFRVRNPLLVVRALPEGVVRLWLDGQRMANPFDVRLPRDSKHKIEARAEGYETSSQTVRIEADAKLTFALRRVAPPAPAHAAASSATPTHAAASSALENGAKTADKRRHGAGFVTTNPY
jgi:hypothetical protein